MSRETLLEMLRCCEAWEPNVCIMGNVRCADAAQALRAALAESTGAEPVEPTGGTLVEQIAEAKRDMAQWPEWMKDAAHVSATVAHPPAREPEPMTQVIQIGDTKTPEGRLATIIAEALGARHPAMDDLAAIVLRGKHPPARQAELSDDECDKAIRESGLWSLACAVPQNLALLRGLCRAAARGKG